MLYVYSVWMRRFVRILLTNDVQPFNAFLSGFSATVGQFVLTGRCYSVHDRKEIEEEADRL